MVRLTSHIALPGGRSRFQAYRERFSTTEGFFTDDAQAVWDFLFTAQSRMAVAGGFMEIGVWKGKSAFLGALHTPPGDPVVLVDISPVDTVADTIRSFHAGEVVSFTGRSSLLPSSDIPSRFRGRIRFFHVDGEHSYAATWADLSLASEMVGSRALIAVDDFGNMRYPQLHAAVYKFLFSRPDFRMVLCGSSKAYLCRAEDFALFDSLIRKDLVAHLSNLGCSLRLARTSYAHDYGCFALEPNTDGRALIGRDEDPDDIVF